MVDCGCIASTAHPHPTRERTSGDSACVSSMVDCGGIASTAHPHPTRERTSDDSAFVS